MRSHLQPFLVQKQQSGKLDAAFFSTVMSEKRTNAILNGLAGATIREINNVAKHFKTTSKEIIEHAPVSSPEKNCDYCAKPFIPAKPKARFCSDACRNKSHRENA